MCVCAHVTFLTGGLILVVMNLLSLEDTGTSYVVSAVMMCSFSLHIGFCSKVVFLEYQFVDLLRLSCK